MGTSSNLRRIAKYQFSNVSEDDWGLNESRGYACEYVAWQFLTYLSHREIIDFLLRELPSPRKNSSALAAAESGSAGFARSTGYCSPMIDERTPLLAGSSLNSRFVGRSGKETQASTNTPEDVCIFEQFSLFAGLNALEIATIAHAKKFLSQNVVQRIIDDIWNGEVIFWDTLSLHSTKEPKIFNRRLVTTSPPSALLWLTESTFCQEYGPLLSIKSSSISKSFRGNLLCLLSSIILRGNGRKGS